MTPSPTPTEAPPAPAPAPTGSAAPPRQMPCPQCGHAMPDLKGGKASICTNCGYKDSCCF
ncbi:MAG: hypothetical protein H0X24_02405 [Ktedonobacterales bacterium]|nr:hypothetical protein [Ktedonobacterales bacterium]